MQTVCFTCASNHRVALPLVKEMNGYLHAE